MEDESDSDNESTMFDPSQAAERLKQAKKRRSQQLKRWAQYEKEQNRLTNRRNKTLSIASNGTLPNGKNSRGRRIRFANNIVLFEAVCRGDHVEVQKLLGQGCSPNVLNTDGLTALHQASIDDNESICKLLLEHGADVNAADSEFWTPLHAAATCGNIRVCKILIDNGANLLAVNTDSNMPYDSCEDSMTLSLIEEEMAKRGITQEQIDAARSERENRLLDAIRTTVESGGSIDRVVDEQQKATCLHVAAAYGFQNLAQYLLDNGASVSIPDADGWLPIHSAACWNLFNMVQLLVQHGADIDAKTRNGEQVYDICNDCDCKRQLLALREQMKRSQSSHKTSRGKLSNLADNKSHRGSNAGRRNSLRSDRRGSISQKEAEVDGNLRTLAAVSLSSSNSEENEAAAEKDLLNNINAEVEKDRDKWSSSSAKKGNGYAISAQSGKNNEIEQFDDYDQNSAGRSDRLKSVPRRCTIC